MKQSDKKTDQEIHELLNGMRRDCQTMILLASSAGHLSVVRLLLQYGVVLNQESPECPPPLYKAAKNGHLEIVRLLIDSGAKLHPQKMYYRSLLYGPVANHKVEVVKFLLELGVKDDEAFCLEIAARDGCVEIVRTLLDSGVDINHANEHGITALYESAQGGHVGVFRLLVSRGADVNKGGDDGSTPLHMFAFSGNLRALKLFLNEYPDINARLKSDIPTESRGRLAGMFGWSYTMRQSTPLHWAVFGERSVDVVTLLLENGADPELRDGDGFTPAAIARKKGLDGLAELLKKAVQAKRADKESPSISGNRYVGSGTRVEDYKGKEEESVEQVIDEVDESDEGVGCDY